MKRMQDKIALVTGGASGIGEEVVRRFLAEGAAGVVIADIDDARGRALANELGERAVFVHHDITSEPDWQATTKLAVDRFGRLDVVVNSAGISVPASVEDATYEHWQKVHRINADGVFLGCKYGLAALKATSKAGSIVNVSSTMGLRPTAYLAAYGSSKASVANLTRSVALHCAEQGYPVRCNAIHPGAIRTPMMQAYLDAAEDPEAQLHAFASVHPMQRVGRPEEVANAILFLASDEASFITGVSLPVDGGYCAA
jgi:3(or 17)beta-hydroxysteroid dehydrogenase